MAAPTTTLCSLRRMSLNFGVAIVLFGVVLFFMLPLKKPDGLGFYLPIALSALSLLATPFVARLKPLPMGMSGEPARAQARKAFTSRLILQYVMAELPVLVAMGAGIVTVNLAPFLVCGVVFELVWFTFGYPSDARIDRAERDLDSGGATSGLRAALTA
jgi:hypothetical protein